MLAHDRLKDNIILSSHLEYQPLYEAASANRGFVIFSSYPA